jgi:hypothetical protein
VALQIEKRGNARQRRQQGADREAGHRLAQYSNRRMRVAALQARQDAQQPRFVRGEVGAIDLFEPQDPLPPQQRESALEGA